MIAKFSKGLAVKPGKLDVNGVKWLRPDCKTLQAENFPRGKRGRQPQHNRQPRQPPLIGGSTKCGGPREIGIRYCPN
jgi:hypothetical protein